MRRLIKKTTAFLTFLVLFFVPLFNVPAQSLDLSAQSAVLMCLNTGEVLYSVNPHQKLSMASTTKIMTSLIALESGLQGMEITVTREMVSVEGTSMGLIEGDNVSLKELVYGMLLQSGNDAANTVAHVLGGTPDGFAVMMNSRAEKIGMKNTSFVTASGLDDEDHYSTAYDMALLACECLENPEFKAICSDKSASLTYGNPPYKRTLTNHNRLLWSYDGAIGVKTGFTKKSGRCLVSAAERDGITLVAVTLNAPNDWSDHRQMLDYGFSVCQTQSPDYDLSSHFLSVYGGVKPSASLKLSYIPKLVKGEEGYEYVALINPYVYAPINAGEIVGELLIKKGNKTVESIPVEAGESIAYKAIEVKTQPESEKNFFTELFNKIKSFMFRGEQ